MELISLRPLWWLLLVPVLFYFWRTSLVDAPFWKRMGSNSLRLIGILLLILALCRPFSFSNSQQLHVVYLLDVSQSIDVDDAVRAVADIQDLINGLSAGDTYTVAALGNDIREFDSATALGDWIQSWATAGTDDTFRSATRIADGLLKARMKFPAGKVKRVVLYGDGQETGVGLDEAISMLGEESIVLHFEKVKSLSKPESAVVDVKPSTNKAFVGEVVRIAVDVASNQIGPAKLRLVHRGVVIQEQPVSLKGQPQQRFFFDVDMVTPGNSKWTAELMTDQDYFPINNQRTCTVSVRGKPRILILHEEIREMRPFARALEQQDVMVEVRGKLGLPENMQGLIEFDAIVLADMAATSMTTRQMELLNRYVRDFGGGLAMFGSENSFGLGGYHRTPVEEVLPLVSRFEKEKEKPSLAMVLVIDKSGSMSGVPIQLARQAAKAAVELLGPRDSVGVVAFDGEPVVVSEMRSGLQSAATAADIDRLDAGGGTYMFPAMAVAKDMLDNTSSKIKHVICLSDGFTQEADHLALTQAMVDSGITVSTVALGEADRQLLASIADAGRGRYYETDDPTNVPQIFTKETMQASKSAIKEDLYGTVQAADHVAMSGFQDADLPFTLGYVMTQPKPTAQVLLIAETGDPLLAISRFGLGVGLAYTSDISERWGGEWLAWEDCGRFWGQVFRSIIRKNDADGVQVLPQVIRSQWNLDIRRKDIDGRPLAKVNWELATLDAQGTLKRHSVREVGLGKYRADVPIEQFSNLTLRLRDVDSNKIKVLNYDRPYPVEYRLSKTLPKAIATLGPVSAAGIRDGLEPMRTRQSIVHWFYLAAILSLLLGNLIRRI